MKVVHLKVFCWHEGKQSLSHDYIVFKIHTCAKWQFLILQTIWANATLYKPKIYYIWKCSKYINKIVLVLKTSWLVYIIIIRHMAYIQGHSLIVTVKQNELPLELVTFIQYSLKWAKILKQISSQIEPQKSHMCKLRCTMRITQYCKQK